MKTASLLSVLMVVVCLVGCENSELITCQEENGVLQGQLEEVKAAVSEKDAQIETLQAQSKKDKQDLMQNFTTMIEKQTAAEKKTKEQLAESQKAVKMWQKKYNALDVEHQNLKGLYENAIASLKSAEQERQKLTNELNKIQNEATN